MPTLKISSADWQRIELAYGHSLSSHIRRKICSATREFLEWAEFEHTARPNSEAVARVQSIKKAVRDFQVAILRCPPGIGRDADYFARNLICKYSGLTFTKGRDGLQNLALDLERRISKGCDFAAVELKRNREHGWRKGDMWDRWVRMVTAALDANQLPTSVRKDTDKIRTDKPSEFVALFRELQACIPAAYRRSQAQFSDSQSNIALSTAIVRARPRHRVTKNSQTAPE